MVEGEAEIGLRSRETGEKVMIRVSGSEPQVVDMPIGWTHNIKNTGDSEMKLLVWVNEVFNPDDPDTFYEEV